MQRTRKPLTSCSEHNIQSHCVAWFRLQYPKYAKLLFAVPNGTYFNSDTRGKAFAYHNKLVAEGLTKGVADLILLLPRGGFGALCVEMKMETGKQSTEQKEWQKTTENNGNKYVVCRSLEQFIKEINLYINSERESS